METTITEKKLWQPALSVASLSIVKGWPFTGAGIRQSLVLRAMTRLAMGAADMTDPNPLREDEVEQVARAIADADCSGLRASGINADIKHWRSFEREARAAIAALDQVREGRGK